jgi:lipid-A-disaccharide synthase
VRLFVSTADASGDMHAAALLRELRARDADLEVFGLGGEELERAGLEPLVRHSDLAVAGLVEVLSSAPRILGGYTALRRALRSRADLAVLVDSPDLNLPLASVARRSGVPVVYYIAPQVWAWRTGRVRKLRRRVHQLGVIFRFEEEFFRAHGVPTRFVGHPLVDRMAAVQSALRPKELAAELGLDLSRPILGLLPGSRRNEISANLPLMVETARLLCASLPDLQVQLMLAPTLEDQGLELPDFVSVVRGNTHGGMALSTCLIAAPGTVTVEAALLGVPLVVMHALSPVTFEIVRRLARVPSSCQVNIIAGAGVVPERLQGQARPAAVAGLVSHLLRDPEAREQMRVELAAACTQLGGPGASGRAADLVLEVADKTGARARPGASERP